jgi:hypothetical protein
MAPNFSAMLRSYRGVYDLAKSHIAMAANNKTKLTFDLLFKPSDSSRFPMDSGPTTATKLWVTCE